MQNLKSDNFVWIIYVNGTIKRKKVESLNIDFEDYIKEKLFENYKLLYKSHANYDSKKN